MQSFRTLARRGSRLLLFGAALLAGQNPPAHPGAPPAAGPQGSLGPASQIHVPQPGYRFPNGQTLVYEVEWRLLNAGTASLHVDTAGPEERITATADSIGVAALLYHVHDRFESYVDPRTYCSTLLTRHIEEGFRRLDGSVRYDYGRRKSLLQEKNLRNGQSKQLINDIPPCVTDVIAGMFYIGSLPLQSGLTFTFPSSDGAKTVDVQAQVEAREEVRTPAGTYQTFRVQPTAATGVLKDKGKVWIWYTADNAHTPVQMRARLFWGTLTFRLQRMERR